MAIVVEIALGFVMEFVMYGIGRAAIAAVTFGRARAERLRELSVVPPAGVKDGDVFVVPVVVTQLIGVALFCAFWIAFFALRK